MPECIEKELQGRGLVTGTGATTPWHFRFVFQAGIRARKF
ncbi:MAG: hypothetical protein H6R13_1501 [Proteobacteria bacterium]|nr:hypothetical protein [Pseudomonadota bacterium]